MSDTSLTKMMIAQHALQERLGNIYFDMDVVDRIEAYKTMHIALIDELHEALQGVTWKSWASADMRMDSTEVFHELRDAWQFLTNMMFIALSELTPGEVAEKLSHALKEKLTINHNRADNDYTGDDDKCPGCKRALDEITPLELYDSAHRVYIQMCSGCEHVLCRTNDPA